MVGTISGPAESCSSSAGLLLLLLCDVLLNRAETVSWYS